MILKEIKYLLRKEILLEWRHKSALNGMLLYIVATVFVVYLSFKIVNHPSTWNALFWIIILFASTNAAAKSFSRESHSNGLYIYSIANPQAIILSKIIYNIFLIIILSFITYIFYSLFVGNMVKDVPMFILSLFLGGMGFASVLTLIAAIASKSGNNFTLMAILSFPVLLPLLITLLKISKNAVDGIERSINYQYMLIVLLINIIVIILSYILFPYLWRD